MSQNLLDIKAISLGHKGNNDKQKSNNGGRYSDE